MVRATLAPSTWHPGGVLQRLQQRVAEGVEEDRLDQRLGRLAARAVRHRDPLFLDPRPGAAGPGRSGPAPVPRGRCPVRPRAACVARCSAQPASLLARSGARAAACSEPAGSLGRRRLGHDRLASFDPGPGQPAVVVVRGAGALGRHHAGADRRLRRAGGAEHLALPRLEHALEHLAALAGLRVGDPDARHREQPLGVEAARTASRTCSAECEMKPRPRHSK